MKRWFCCTLWCLTVQGWSPSGLRPGAKAFPEDFALPLLTWAKDNCITAHDEHITAQVLAGLVNSSGHLHWRVARSGWLLGSITMQEFPATLHDFVEGRFPLSIWHGTCLKVLIRATSFYITWRHLLEAMVGQLHASEYVNRVRGASAALNTYFLSKEAKDPIYLQERQVAKLQRSVIARNSGVASNPCTCQLYYNTMLRTLAKTYTFARRCGWKFHG
eukprot:symbB.v1.2.008767.t1/scaffold549.1/size255684/8